MEVGLWLWLLEEEIENLREDEAVANAFPRGERTLKFAIIPTSRDSLLLFH